MADFMYSRKIFLTKLALFFVYPVQSFLHCSAAVAMSCGLDLPLPIEALNGGGLILVCLPI